MNPQVLIADDEPDVRNLLRTSLTRAGFQVAEAGDGAAALEQIQRLRPSIVVLDIMMPQLTGLEVLRLLKGDRATAQIPIVLLSAHADEVNRILGLELGAEDFLTKPFSPRELILRLRNLLRCKQPPAPERQELRIGAIFIDQERHQVIVNGEFVTLTTIEFKLLLLLAGSASRVLSRDHVLTHVWGAETEIDGRTVDTHIRRLREKLGDAGGQIRTVRGFGYRLDAEATANDARS